MFAENSGLAVLVQICWPAAIAIYLTFAFSRGGPGRLWRDTAALTVIIALLALWDKPSPIGSTQLQVEQTLGHGGTHRESTCGRSSLSLSRGLPS